MIEGLHVPNQRGFVSVPEPATLRSGGRLGPEAIAACREMGVALAYDPVQIGWVRADCEDDILEDAPLSWHVSRPQSGAYLFRLWSSQDAPMLARMLSAPRLWTYTPEDYGGPVDPGTARDLIALINDADHQLVRAVEFGGQVIGQARLEFRDGDRTAAEISYWIDEACWGQGHGSAIVCRFADDSFRRSPELARLFARVHQDNPASARVLAKAGFRLHDGEAEGPWQHYERARGEHSSGST